MKVVLISTYELGHQPFGLASPAAWLSGDRHDVTVFDLAVQRPDVEQIKSADLIAFYLPMHTATRIAIPVISKARELNPDAHFCAYGLYAPMNSEFLRSFGVDSIIGGEFEVELSALVNRLDAPEGNNHRDISGREIFLTKQEFKIPNRTGLPDLGEYAYLTMPDGTRRTVGYTEASRGCKHLCRHCPIVPVYGGVFRIVQRDVVLSDIGQQVKAGARHITFGDPDFFNGAGHAIKIVRALHEKWPDLTYDVTIKIEHLVKHKDKLETLRETGCLFVISAVESVDDRILKILDKGHTRADFVEAVALCRDVGLALTPTFVTFTPWITLEGYEDLLRTIVDLDLVDSVSPIQLAIRLLIPRGSKLLELDETTRAIGEFDTASLCYLWQHPDPRVDLLHGEVLQIVEEVCDTELPRGEIFERVWGATQHALGREKPNSLGLSARTEHKIPSLSEPWYCCAEPTQQQLDTFI